MVLIALALLVLTATIVGLNTLGGRWGMRHWRWVWVPASLTPPGTDADQLPPREPAKQTFKEKTKELTDPKKADPASPAIPRVITYGDTAIEMEQLPHLVPFPSPAMALQDAVAAACRASLDRSGFFVFSNWMVFTIFVGFLLPIWSLSFATEALGGDREGRNLVWLLTRPMPRAAIYLAKFVAILPWSVALNVGGFGLLCLLAGAPGHLAFSRYWPAVLGATLAFSALFHMMSACFRRAAVVALVYSFFLETLLGSMPGYMKRVSIAFYTRCLMFDAAKEFGVEPEKPSIYLPVDGMTAWSVLASVTVALLLAGMVVFSRTEYQDLA
jgi:ABC-type transport system involved in multi-copper enzyme maturation permease subunit